MSLQRSHGVSAAIAILLATSGAIVTSSATAQVPADGRQFTVNTATGGTKWFPGVVARRDGSFIVAWAGAAVRGRRISADGRPVGQEFSASEASGTWGASVAASASGGFVVSWRETSSYPLSRVVARRMSSAGERQGDLVVVTESAYWDHDVAMAPNGEFAVTWSDWYGQIWVQTFDASGARVSEEVVERDGGGEAAIAASPIGDFIVVWRGLHEGSQQILGQRLTGAGEKLGVFFEVSIDAAREAVDPDIAISPDGGFVVVWSQSPGDIRPRMVAGQRFNRDGVRVGPRFLVQEETLDRVDRLRPAVTVGRSGEFFVVWEGADLTFLDGGLYGQLFDPAGAQVGPAIEISTQSRPDTGTAAAMASTGSRLVVWSGPSGVEVKGLFLDGAIAGDQDGDAVPDAADNCPTIANVDQADAQADGYGDACVSPDVVLPADLFLGGNPIVGAGTIFAEKTSFGDRVRIGELVACGAWVRGGDDLRVDDLAVIGAATVIGDRVAIGESARTEGAVKIGDDVTIGERVVLRRRVSVGAGAVIEPWVVAFAGATIGPGATVESGARIGRLATVSPGAVVPSGTTVPAGTVFP